MKLLPFALADQRPGTAEAPLSEKDSNAAPTGERQCLQVLHSLARVVAERFHPTKSNVQAMSLSDADVLGRLATSDSLSDAQLLISQLRSPQSIRVSYRITGMIAATLLLPFFTTVSMALMTIIYHRQEASMPRVGELSDIMMMIQQEPNVARPETIARVRSLRTYVRANDRDAWEDPAQRKSLYGQMLFTAYQTELNQIFSAPDPTSSKAEAAAIEFARIREDQGTLPRMKTIPFSMHNAFFWAAVTWLELVWLPSLVTAVLFRGGLCMRLFGLTLANARGKPASRLRVLLRMFATGVVPICVMVLLITFSSWNANDGNMERTMQFASASFIVIACLAVVIYRSRRRFFSDRLAGTYLVAR